MAETDNEEALRSKRTIGILRQLFPDISQVSSRDTSIIREISENNQRNSAEGQD